MFSPLWAQMKIGPLLRGESDFRFYHDLFRTRVQEVGILREMCLQCVARRQPEPDDFGPPEPRVGSRPVVVVFEGLRDYFRRLDGWHEFLYKEIRAMTRNRWLAEADKR